MQPLLPVREIPRTADYFPDGQDGVAWVVREWPELKQAFDIEDHELEAWHADLAAQGRPWLVIKRIFGVMAVFGDATEDEDEEDWNWKKLAARESVPEAALKADLEAAVDYWKKQRVARSVERPAADGSVKPVDRSAVNAIRDSLSEERIKGMLEEYRFDHLKGKDRVFVAQRIVELRSIFEDKNRREAAHQLVHMELNLRDNETSRALLKARLETLSHKADKGELQEKDSTDIRLIQESLDKNETAHTRLFDKYLAASSSLGAEEIQTGDLRKVALGTLSQFIEAQREFYGTGDRMIIDGMFTADELVWQTTPLPLRPGQYRPDIVTRVNEAMKPENLWSGDYTPTKIQREASRRMLKIAKALVEEEEPAHIPEIDDVSNEDGEESANTADFSADPDPAAPPAPHIEPAARPDEEFMAIG